MTEKAEPFAAGRGARHAVKILPSIDEAEAWISSQAAG
jgi:hypothetical protein